MDYYLPNRRCYCARCRCRGYMGPVVLITLGVLFLLSEFTHWHFHQTWPILLIAIGLVKVLGSSADINGHVPPYIPGVSAAPVVPGTVPPQNPPQPPQGVSNV
jgi:Domain of unknown function (DUF5668)